MRQWNIAVASSPAENMDDASRQLAPLLTDANNLQDLLRALEEAVTCSHPDEMLDEWIDREPAACAVIDFIAVDHSGPVSIEAIAESNATISEIITKAAAGVMLRGGFSDHFRYLADGTLTIDPSNPPSLEQAHELLQRTLEIKETASRLDNYSAWMLGMIADQFETYFGSSFDPSVIMAQTSRAYNTYVCALGTYRAWWTEKRNLSYTHHREVQYAKHLDHVKGGMVLDISEKFGLNVLQQRKVISYARHFDLEELAGDLAAENTTVEDVMERVEIRSVNKRYIFFLRAANRWYEYKGPFENIPNGASPIINADTRQIMGQDGRSTKPDAWVPVGEPTEAPTIEIEQEDES